MTEIVSDSQISEGGTSKCETSKKFKKKMGLSLYLILLTMNYYRGSYHKSWSNLQREATGLKSQCQREFESIVMESKWQ